MPNRSFGLAVLFAAGVLVAGAVPGHGDVNEGFAAYQSGDYETAYREFLPEAQRGNLWAQHAVGVMYERGEGVPNDDVEAVRWHRKAAEQGHAPSQYNLGRMYEQGKGVSKDDAEAVSWYRKAADAGLAEAKEALREYEPQSLDELIQALREEMGGIEQLDADDPRCASDRTIIVWNSDKSIFQNRAVKIAVLPDREARSADTRIGLSRLRRAYPGVHFMESLLWEKDVPEALKRGIIDLVAYCHRPLDDPEELFGLFEELSVWMLTEGQSGTSGSATKQSGATQGSRNSPTTEDSKKPLQPARREAEDEARKTAAIAAVPDESSKTMPRKCSGTVLAGVYETQYGPLSCKPSDDGLRCCYGSRCEKQVELRPDVNGERLVGVWHYPDGSTGPAQFPVSGQCELGSGGWGWAGERPSRPWRIAAKR